MRGPTSRVRPYAWRRGWMAWLAVATTTRTESESTLVLILVILITSQRHKTTMSKQIDRAQVASPHLAHNVLSRSLTHTWASALAACNPAYLLGSVVYIHYLIHEIHVSYSQLAVDPSHLISPTSTIPFPGLLSRGCCKWASSPTPRVCS